MRYKQLVNEYKEKARRKYDNLKRDRKKRRSLPISEQWELWKKDRQKRLAWKKRIYRVCDTRERYAQKKGYKYYRKLQHRKVKWGIFIAVVLWIGLSFLHWYWSATRPLTAEQQQARDHSVAVAERVQSEGMVLLRNEHSTLPLANKKVSVFGTTAAKPVYGGGGAGGISSGSATDLYTAFDKEGIQYNKSLYNLYNNYAYHQKATTEDFKRPGKSLLDTLLPSIGGFLAGVTPEMPAKDLSSDVVKQAAAYSDTAIYAIGRAGTETQDLTPAKLRLSSDERATLQQIDDHFKHVVLIVNSTNAMELGFVESMKHVDAVLWVGATGEVGTYSVAKALTGEVNPSGRLTDTYAYNVESNPAVTNTGDFQYVKKDGTKSGRYFVKYKEGIYTGYRYYETFVPENEYRQVVQYPFGYGMSYTTFKWDVVNTKTNSDTIQATVRVTNTGKVAGKDVVELYYRAPYTAGGVEKSAINLGGYAKTKELKAGESQDVTVTFTTDSMASYDSTTAKSWVLDAGTYTLSVARNVHDIVDTFSYHQSDKKVIATDSKTGATVTNRFDDRAGDMTILSRANPEGTMPKAPTNAEYTLPTGLLDKDYKHVKKTVAEPTTGAKNNIKLAELKGLSYNDPKWNTFLDQYTDKELVSLAGNGGYWTLANKRLGVPSTTMYDGPASIRNFLQSWASTAYPVPVVLSSTWNESLAEEVGSAMGAEAKSFGVDAVYAPSLNLHRSPLGGRNFEYYSEDPLIAGKTGAAYTRGLQSHKVIAVMKHFAMNDQETNRAAMGLYTWANEQTIRELYLKPFEITEKEGTVNGVMTAFNRIGTTWAGGDAALLNDTLRGEWGFKGFVITDAGIGPQGEHFDALQATEAGNDLLLSFLIDTPGKTKYEKQLTNYLKEDRAGTLVALRNSAHNILYYVLQTNKM